MRRVLAVDLGLDAATIDSCLAEAAPPEAVAAGAAKITLAEALRIVATAESMASAGARC